MTLATTLMEAAEALETSLRHVSSGGEYNDSNGQTLALADIHRYLLTQGLKPYPTRNHPSQNPPAHNQILTNKQQVDIHGTVLGRKLPDRAFVDGTGRRPVRVNVEVDVDPQSMRQSRQKLLGTGPGKTTDPQARHVFVQVDPDTGRVTRWEVYEPGRRRPRLRGTGSLPARAFLTRPKGRQRTVIAAQREALPFF